MEDPQSFYLQCDGYDIPCTEYGDPDHLIQRHKGQVIVIDMDAEEAEAGTFTIAYVDFATACERRVLWYDVLDADSDHMARFYKLLNRGGSDWSPWLERKVYRGISGGNLLVLEWLELKPEYRGKRLGLRVLRQLMERFGNGADVVALEAHPIQHLDDPTYKVLLSAELAKGAAKLRQYYARLGFVRVPRSLLMVRTLDRVLPSVDELMA